MMDVASSSSVAGTAATASERGGGEGGGDGRTPANPSSGPSSSWRSTLQKKRKEKKSLGSSTKKQQTEGRLFGSWRSLLSSSSSSSSSWRSKNKRSNDTEPPAHQKRDSSPGFSDVSGNTTLSEEALALVTSREKLQHDQQAVPVSDDPVRHENGGEPGRSLVDCNSTQPETTTTSDDDKDGSERQWTKDPEVSFRFDVENIDNKRDARNADSLNHTIDDSNGTDEEEGSFLKFFLNTKGPPQIMFLCVVLALSLGSTIGVVPPLVTDRYARQVYGLDEDVADCSTFHLSDRPQECTEGNDAAQNAAAVAALISNGLTFATSSVIGSVSDEYGRRGLMLIGIFLSTLGPLCLLLLQLIPTMSPTWYYGLESVSGVVNWVAVSYSSLADVIPKQWRAPTFGLVLASFAAGFGFAPSLTLGLGHFGVTVFSFSLVCGSFVFAIFFLPETLSPQDARAARRARAEREGSFVAMSVATATSSSLVLDPGTSRPRMLRRASSLGNIMLAGNTMTALLRPVRELSILNRNQLIRLLAILAFFSGMSGAADRVLLLYYVEERLGFNDKDVAAMFLIIGVLGISVQAVVLKPLNDWIGERMVIVVSFTAGVVHNVLYGLATTKQTVFVGIALSTLTLMSFPTISAIKSNNVKGHEQGRIQGALYSVQSLSSALGPTTFRFIYHVTRDLPYPGPGTMFFCTALLFFFATVIAIALPADRTDSRLQKNIISKQDGVGSEIRVANKPSGSDTTYGSTDNPFP